MTNWPPEQASPWPVETFAGLEATGRLDRPKPMANCDYALKKHRDSAWTLARKPTSRVSLCDTTRQSSPSTKRTNRGLPVRRPIRRLRRADHNGGHALTSSPHTPFVFFSLFGARAGGGLAKTHGAFPRGANILSLLPKTTEGHMYICASVDDASGGHSSIEGSRERMMRHLCICLHKSQTHHGKDTTSDAPAKHASRNP